MVKNGLISNGIDDQACEASATSVAIERLLLNISTTLSIPKTDALKIVNDCIACVVVDRINQLVKLEECLYQFSYQFTEAVDPSFKIVRELSVASTISSKLSQSISSETAGETQTLTTKKGKSKSTVATYEHIQKQVESHLR
jgi:hypothetical protein